MTPEQFSQIRGALRHLLTFGGGYLVARGKLSPEDLTTILGALGTLTGVAWSFYEKRRKQAAEVSREGRGGREGGISQ